LDLVDCTVAEERRSRTRGRGEGRPDLELMVRKKKKYLMVVFRPGSP
jgi:hypothetical protein